MGGTGSHAWSAVPRGMRLGPTTLSAQPNLAVDRFAVPRSDFAALHEWSHTLFDFCGSQTLRVGKKILQVI